MKGYCFMKTFIKCFLSLISLMIIVCLTGCACIKTPTQNSVTNEEKSEEINSKYSQKLSSILKSSSGTYSFESEFLSENVIISSDDSESQFSLLNFTDGSTNTKIVLCNKPNCNHNDSSCSAYFVSWLAVKRDNGNVRFAIMHSDGYVFLYNDRLYVLDPFGDLIEMDKDGSNHKNLLSIDSKYYINNGFLYKDCIYLCVKYLPSYDSSVEQEFSDADYNIAVLKVDLKTNKCEEIFSFKTELDTTCLGIYENKAYFFYRSPNTQATANTQQAVDNEKNSHNIAFYYYDLSNPERKYVIKNIKSYEFDDAAFDKNGVYYHNRKEGKLIKLNLDTGEKEDILTDVGGYIEIHTPIEDDKLYFTKDNMLSNAFSPEPQTNETYCVDLNTGEVNKI